MPSSSIFPDPRTIDDDCIAVGGALHPELLVEAYLNGIFPWPMEGTPHLPWFCPKERAILRYADLKIPKSLAKFAKKAPYSFSFDQKFSTVIDSCASAQRPGQSGTWINEAMQQAYLELHRLGIAHSLEVWSKETGDLVGGLYGVLLEGVFSGESMFHTQPNASKLGLIFLMEKLHDLGVDWIDIQMMTPHLEALGAIALPRSEYLELLEKTQLTWRARKSK